MGFIVYKEIISIVLMLSNDIKDWCYFKIVYWLPNILILRNYLMLGDFSKIIEYIELRGKWNREKYI